ncbi:ferredoxin [Streptomyces lancefieldiae]|uniref:Ferredoxin n=1 Tax=Streptomyces lancefieldiae TaxID=3075520 RepID=A0ABU3AYW1_9ACTN|nr:ferredoxin [Streptomyces sp. DSM 40712]MDT0615368.1 ferredoxin [Streptomyces sp. DSM 40712]
MKITVDHEKCCASGQCAMLAPDVFEQREEDGLAVVLLAEPDPGLHDAAREAAAYCPTTAILVEE